MASFWTPVEQAGFAAAETGQITVYSEEGRSIMDLLQKKNIETVVEIGTWNGLGSTLCILYGIQGKNTRFWSLECNKEKHDAAVESLSDFIDERVRLLWGSIVDISGVMHESYLSNFPSLAESDELKMWFKVDMENCAACPKVLDDLPEKIDFLLLDGGEFTTLHEFTQLFSRCVGYIALDDTNIDKCKKVRKILTENFEWCEIVCLNKRNGFSIFERVPY
jgi:hypothetical protein